MLINEIPNFYTNCRTRSRIRQRTKSRRDHRKAGLIPAMALVAQGLLAAANFAGQKQLAIWCERTWVATETI